MQKRQRNTWPIIVGGYFRSGTSLVRRILNAHPRIHCGPEVKFFRDFFGDYQSDDLAHARFFASARSILPETELLKIYGEAFLSVHESACISAGKNRWADKNPENSIYWRHWQTLLADSWLFIHVVRSPLDTMASLVEHPFSKVVPASLADRIAQLTFYHGCALEMENLFPSRYFRLHYENLVQAPKTCLEKLFSWLGEPYQDSILAFNDVSHQEGLEDPKVKATKHIHSFSVGRYARILSSNERAEIVRETLPLWKLLEKG